MEEDDRFEGSIGALPRYATPLRETPFDRRRYLRRVGSAAAGAAGIALAGCGTPDGDRPEERTTDVGRSEVRTANAGGLRETLQQAEVGETVVVDTDETLQETLQWKSGVDLRGDGGMIRIAGGADADGIRTADVSDVIIRDITIDGQRDHQHGGNALIGGRNLGHVRNVRVQNCTLLNSYGNSITFHVKSGEVNDVYIGYNRIDRTRRHNVLFGVDGAGEIHDVIIEGNKLTNWYQAQAVGCFGQGSGWAYDVAMIGNYADHSVQRDNEGGYTFEERTHNCLLYANHVNDITGNGLSTSKEGYHNLIAENDTRNLESGSGSFVGNFRYHEPDGPPYENVVTCNYSYNDTNGAREQMTNGNNLFYRNRLEAWNSRRFVDRDIDGPPDHYGNDTGVPKADAGVPDGWATTTSIRYPSQTGYTAAEASWSRGSSDPDDPVTVDVNVYPNNW